MEHDVRATKVCQNRAEAALRHARGTGLSRRTESISEMDDSEDFARLIRRIRAGDAEAAEELVKSYESDLRIIARVKLNDPRLRRLVDSMDICQSIFGNFFVRAYTGQFEIETPEQLMNLLATMIRNKVTDHARRHTARLRNIERIAGTPVDELPLLDHQPSAESVVAAREITHEVRRRLTIDELAVVDRRMNDLGWDEIAAELGGSPDALRKKMTRAMNRVSKELGLIDSSNAD